MGDVSGAVGPLQSGQREGWGAAKDWTPSFVTRRGGVLSVPAPHPRAPRRL